MGTVRRQVVIVGVGALGSHVLQLLRNVDARFKVIDFDRVESKNLRSQFHGKPSVGKNKAVALQQAMQFLWDERIEAVPHKLSYENAGQLLSGASLVIDCLDNAVGRNVVQAQVRAMPSRPACLHAALDAAGSFGRVCWDEQFQADEETPGAATCEDGAFLPFIALVAALTAQAAQQYLQTGRQTGWLVHPAGAVRT